MKKRLKINGIIMVCAALAVAFFPKFFLRNILGNFWEISLEVAGVALILLGQIIRVSARGYKAEHSWESRALIQSGPYQVVRNPMYLGIFLIGLGVVLVIFKWWAILIFLTVFIIRYILLIYNEEKKLLSMFPNTYKNYCKKVPRILPSLFSMAKLDIVEYLPLKLVWFKKEIGSILTLLLLILLVESWKDIVSEGVRAYFRQVVWLFLTFLIFTFMVILLSKRTEQRNEDSTNKS
jgi:protein-S-isoprenylcysteine O-methyltransferase Ste14